VQNPRILEISVETVAAAVAAERGGADRIELCQELRVGGLTPGVQLMRATREQVRLPIFAMIRPRGGSFVYSDAEFSSMRSDIAAAKRHSMNGIVLGILKQDRRVDVARTRELVELARPLAVTFHRAFDESADLHESLEDVIKTGAARILTSGGVPTAPEGLAMLAKLLATAGRRIIIVPSSGLNASNILGVARETKAREFHSGLSSVLSQTETDCVQFAAQVRKLASELAR